ncbi:uncharacterized protein LOC119576459 [Penaeus monodon]|uniref:uncharacterized protein LOC119576459 n=1 Tax=Penaeus monodon TaxID=6687 RepID=UPI0018A777BB|nr:uncharacterized protein LOC119576459 [Penaeus monodon]
MVRGCVGEEGKEEMIEIEEGEGVTNRSTVRGRWCAAEVDKNLNIVAVKPCPILPPVTDQLSPDNATAFLGEREQPLTTSESPVVIERPPPATTSESPVETEQPPSVTSKSPAPTEVPPLCVPFRYGEEIVSGCVGEEGEEQIIEIEGEEGVINRGTVSGRWCASEVDKDLNVLSIISCPTMPLETEQAPSVNTSESPAPTEVPPLCVPFRHGEEIVSGCVGEEGEEQMIEIEGEGVINRGTVSGRWCASEVDENLNVLSIISCPTIPTPTEVPPLCVPFRYGEEIVSGCVGEEGEEQIIEMEGEGGVINRGTVSGRWCASEVDKNQNVLSIIPCPTMPNATEQQPPVTASESPVETEQPPSVTSESPAPTEVPPLCVPFRHGEEIVSACVGEEGEEQMIEIEGEGGVINRGTVSGRWCASEVDKDLNVLSIISCPTMPHATEQQPPVISSESPVETEQAPSVKTSESPAPAEVPPLCVPFRHGEEIVSGCVGEEGEEQIIEIEGEGGVINRGTVSGRWCASDVDKNLNVLSIISCPTMPLETEQAPSVNTSESPAPTEVPPLCVPFRHGEEIVSGCVGEEGEEQIIEMEGEGGVINRGTVSGRWCASEVDENQNVLSIIPCPTMSNATEQQPPVTDSESPVETEQPPSVSSESPAPTEVPPLCVPFRHGEEIVSGCVGEEGEEQMIEIEGEGGVINRGTVSGRWCASEVDENQNVLSIISCPTMPNVTEQQPSVTSPVETEQAPSVNTSESPAPTEVPRLCVPFRHGEEIVSGCVGEEGEEQIIEMEGEGGVINRGTVSGRWCASEVDENLNVLSIIPCPTMPNATEQQPPVTSSESSVETEQPPSVASESPAPTEVPPLCVPFRRGEEIVSGCVGEEGEEQIIEMEGEGGMINRGTVSGRWCASEVDENLNVLSIISCPTMPLETEQAPSVNTSESPAPNEVPPLCVPFRYGEEIVSGCVGEEGEEQIIEIEGEGGVINRGTVNGRWCASEVDENLNVLSIISCPTMPLETEQAPSVNTSESSAPTEVPPLCVPFRYGEEIVSGCVGEEGEEQIIEIEGEGGVINRGTVNGRWCASEVDENLNVLSIISCPTMPHATEQQPPVTDSESPVETEQPPSVTSESPDITEEAASVSSGEALVQTEQPPSLTASKGNHTETPIERTESRSGLLETVSEEPPQVTYSESPVYAVTVDGKICVFPFTWKGVSYSNCTTVERRIPWCATQLNERREPVSSGYCKDTLMGPVPSEPPPFEPDERVTNTSKCKFPFVYKGMTYFTCTREDWLIPWCALDVDRNRRPTRVGCCHGQDGVPFHSLQTEGPGGISPTQLTVGGEQCIFPFQHDGEWHYSCVPSEEQGREQGQGKGRSWCVTRVDAFAQPIAADYCVESSTQASVSLADERRTTDGLVCVFPFWHQGRWFKDCTRTDAEEDPWCATEIDAHGAVLKAGKCRQDTAVAGQTCKARVGMENDADRGDDVATETASGVPCVFPFVHRGRRYCQCTSVDERAPWCATRVDGARRVIAGAYCTENRTHEDVDMAGEPKQTADGSRCVFPFYYKGNRYSKCHPIERAKSWCPVMVNARLEPLQSGYCDDGTSEFPWRPPPVVLGLTMTVNLGPCVFPFWYKGEVHERCTCKDAPACWCPTSLNDNREPAVTDYCKGLLEGPVPEVSPPALGADAATTVEGRPCVFPFRFGDVIYTRCAEASRGAPWCATQVDAALRPVRSGFCKGIGDASDESPEVLSEGN